MKNNSKFYILFLLASCFTFTSCLVDDEVASDIYDQGPNLVGFNSPEETVSVVADGTPVPATVPVNVTGPTFENLEGDISVTFEVNEELSTAVEGVHYQFEPTTLTLVDGQNYMDLLPFTVLTEGIEAPSAETLVFDVTEVTTNEEGILINGRTGQVSITISYKCFSDLAGNYYVQYSDGSTTPLVITETGTGEYTVDNLFTVTPAGFDWYFSDVCGELLVTGFELSSYNLYGTGTVNEDGSLTFIGLELEGITPPYNVTLYPN